MKLVSYEFDRDKLIINFDTKFSKIKLQKLEANTKINTDSCLKLECDFIQFTFSKPKSTVCLCTSSGTQVVILVVIDVDDESTNEAIMLNKRRDEQSDGTNEQDVRGLTDSNTKPFEKNEYQHIYATIRRKVKNGDRQTISEVKSDMCVV